MSLDDPVILTCAISGAVANREQCPAIPYTPEEYAAEARRIVDEGGGMIHIHARRPDGTPSYEIEDFRAITEAILAEAGGTSSSTTRPARSGVPVEKRIAYLRELRPDVGRAEHGLDELREVLAPPPGAGVLDASSRTRSTRSSSCCKAMSEAGIKPEHECFDLGHLGSSRR